MPIRRATARLPSTAYTGARGNARAISSVTRSAPPYVSMKSWVMTTRAARAASRSAVLSASVVVGGVVAKALRVPGTDIGEDDPGRAGREPLEGRLCRTHLLDRRVARPQAQQHGVGLRNQLERVCHRQQRRAV